MSITNIQKRWNARAVGEHCTSAPKGSLQYFEEMRAYRYGYELPCLPEFCGFARLKGVNVLEIGTGAGIDGVEMARNGAIYSGLDITKNHIELTKANFRLHNLPIDRFYEGDLLAQEIETRFAYIYSFGVLHHIDHEQQVLQRIRKLMQPGGRLVVGLYSKYSFFNAYISATWLLQNRMRTPLAHWQCHKTDAVPLDNPIPARIRSRKQIESMLALAGFEIESHRKCGFTQGYLPGVGKLLPPQGRMLSVLGRLLGWYHIFIARPVSSTSDNDAHK